MNAKLFSVSLLTAGVLLASASQANASGYKFTDLVTLGGGSSGASGINNSGQVVGYSLISGDSTYHATIWNGTTPTDLGTLGGSWSFAIGINDSGQVVGYSSTVVGTDHVTIWNGTTPTDLGTLGRASFGYGINNSGQVVGWSNILGNSTTHATIWNGTTPTDLGTLGGSYSIASGINNSGQVVGWSDYGATAFNSHATLWNGTTPTDLNDFLSVSEVNAGWVLIAATGINDNGWVVGNAYNTITGVNHAFLLTSVPEPETYALFMAGLGLMGFIARRRKNDQA